MKRLVITEPSAFDARPPYRHARGTAFYRARVRVTRGRAAELRFGACALTCRVYVDDHPLRTAHTDGGFTPFSLLVPASSEDWRTVLVVADNRFDAKAAPLHLPRYDWYQYGGLLRPVILSEVGDVYLERLEVREEEVASDDAAARDGRSAYVRVGKETRAWRRAGDIVVFDDSFEHDARNDGDAPRMVLAVQLLHPDLGEGTLVDGRWVYSTPEIDHGEPTLVPTGARRRRPKANEIEVGL